MFARKSLFFTLFMCAGCTALSAYMNLAVTDSPPIPGQPRWIIDLHIGAAVLGSLLIARFVVGSPEALNGPMSKSVYGVGMVIAPRTRTFGVSLPGQNSFFSGKRIAQLLGFIVCLMVQFISIAAPTVERLPDHTERPTRMNATKGSLAT
jgi:hypothetical protein